MARFDPAPFGLKFLVAVVFLGGAGFGAVAALTRGDFGTAPQPTIAMLDKPSVTTEAKPSEPILAIETKPAESKPKPKPKPTEAKPKPSDAKPKPTEVAALTFEKDIKVIFKSKCTTCHGDAGAKGGVDLRTLKDALANGIVPGKLDASTVWESIAKNEMPPPGKEKLTQEEKNLISKWISSGAK